MAGKQSDCDDKVSSDEESSSRSQPEGTESKEQFTEDCSRGRVHVPSVRTRRLATGHVGSAATSNHKHSDQTLKKSASVPTGDGYNLDLRSDMSASGTSSARRIDNTNDDLTMTDSRVDTALTPSDGNQMPSSIAVTGLPETGDNTERLQKYFSARCRSGGDKIQKSYWDQQHYAFIISFGSNEPVKRVIERTHERGGVTLDVIPVELDDVSCDLCRTFCVDCDNFCTVYNFLNHVGVHPERFEQDEENKRIVVIVSSRKDLRRVQLETVSQIEVEFEDTTLRLTRMEPICWTPWVGEKVEDKTVFLSRIKRGFSEKEVTDYFKQYFRIRKSENEVREATAVKNQRALVHFRNSIDFKKMRRWVQQNSFKADMVAVEQIPASTCIRVTNCGPLHDYLREELADHFSAVIESVFQASDVTQDKVSDDDIQLFHDEYYVTVKFPCRPVLDRVLREERCRQFQGRELKIALEYDE